MYIVIEGQDATGKSTQVELMAEYLRGKLAAERRGRGMSEAEARAEAERLVLTMHEPDGDLESAHVMRELIKNREYGLEPLTHVLLFTAARVELWKKLAEPVLREGGYVISARNWWSTLAYQGYGQGVSRDKIIRITKQLMPARYVEPDKAVILTLTEEERLARQRERNVEISAAGSAKTELISEKDTFESKPTEFQDRVNAAYVKIAEQFGIKTWDMSGEIEKNQAGLRKEFGL